MPAKRSGDGRVRASDPGESFDFGNRFDQYQSVATTLELLSGRSPRRPDYSDQSQPPIYLSCELAEQHRPWLALSLAALFRSVSFDS